MSSFLVSWMPAIRRVAGSHGFMVVVEEMAIRQDWLLAEGITTLAAGPEITFFPLLVGEHCLLMPPRKHPKEMHFVTSIANWEIRLQEHLEERHAKHQVQINQAQASLSKHHASQGAKSASTTLSDKTKMASTIENTLKHVRSFAPGQTHELTILCRCAFCTRIQQTSDPFVSLYHLKIIMSINFLS